MFLKIFSPYTANVKWYYLCNMDSNCLHLFLLVYTEETLDEVQPSGHNKTFPKCSSVFLLSTAENKRNQTE